MNLEIILDNMFDIGSKEIIIIAVLVILLFGPKKIPELAKGIGEAIKTLRGGFKDNGDKK